MGNMGYYATAYDWTCWGQNPHHDTRHYHHRHHVTSPFIFTPITLCQILRRLEEEEEEEDFYLPNESHVKLNQINAKGGLPEEQTHINAGRPYHITIM